VVDDSIVILDQRVKPEQLEERLQALADNGRPFSLVMIDTLAAFFDGDDMNDNVQGGQFMRRLRPLTRLPGLPSVIVAAHPVKNAAEDNLVPYGGGAILNEVDGNLTLKASNGLTELHWQGKLRGVEFDPATFRFELMTSPKVLDNKGREVRLPVVMPSSDREVERREQASIGKDEALLKAMTVNPSGTINDWAAASKIHKEAAKRALYRLAKPASGKLVQKTLRKWTITRAGIKAIEGPIAEIQPPTLGGEKGSAGSP
jgi:hypothetical protein